jgi:hypothetical protein
MENNDDPECPDQTEAQYPSPGTICSQLPETPANRLKDGLGILSVPQACYTVE